MSPIWRRWLRVAKWVAALGSVAYGPRMAHPSDSDAQLEAQPHIVEAVGHRLGVKLRAGGRISVGGDAFVEVDARSDDSGGGDVFVEAYARQGRLKSAQVKKV